MPKEKYFDQDIAIEICIDLFGQFGYSATGIQQIVDATGVNRSSLYSTFGGKDKLFLDCLKKSVSIERAAIENIFSKSKNVLKGLEIYLTKVTKGSPEINLLKNTYAEYSLLNSITKKTITEFHQWRISFLSEQLSKAKKSGLTKKISDSEISELISLFSNGIVIGTHVANYNKTGAVLIGSIIKLLRRKKS